jgi:hypothetical protein
LASEFESAWSEIQTYAASNRDGVQLDLGPRQTVEVISTEGAVHQGWLGETVMSMDQDSLSSLLYVFEKDQSYIKYRMSYELASESTIAPAVQTFLQATLATIQPPGR